MACQTKSKTITRMIHTDRSSATAHFLVFGRFKVDDWTSIRPSIIMDSSSGDLTAEAAVRYGNDDAELDAASTTGLGVTIAADGAAYGTSFSTLSTTNQFVEVGLDVKNTAASAIELATGTMIIDLRN